MGRDLHDDLSPHLIGIEALSEVLKLRLEKKSKVEARELEKIRQLINEAITKTHRLVKGLCPIELGIEGLSAALGNLAQRISSIYGVTCRFAGNSASPAAERGQRAADYEVQGRDHERLA